MCVVGLPVARDVYSFGTGEASTLNGTIEGFKSPMGLVLQGMEQRETCLTGRCNRSASLEIVIHH